MRLFPNTRFNTPKSVQKFGGIGTSGNTGNNGNTAPSAPRVPALKTPDKPRIDIAPADQVEVAAPQSISDTELYKFVVSESFKQARDARSQWEPQWKLSLEFFNTKQWWGYDSNVRKFVNYRSSDPNPLRFSTTNLIRPRIETVGSMVTQSSPDSNPVPMTTREIDRKAAAEARSVIANYNRLYDNKNQVRRMVDWAMTHTSVFLKTTFEPSAMADRPLFADEEPEEGTADVEAGEPGVQSVPGGNLPSSPGAALPPQQLQQPQQSALPPQPAGAPPSPVPAPPEQAPAGPPEEQGPEIIGIENAQIGDIVERIIPGTNIFIDPSCARFEDARWLIHAEVYPLSWFYERFENGKDVRPDAGTGSGTVSSRGSDLSDGGGIGTSYGLGAGDPGVTASRVNANVATCYEMWILPGKAPLFPMGAYIVCAGGVVLKPKNDGGSPTATEAAWAKAMGAKLSDEQSVTKAKRKIPGSYLPWPYACTTEFPFVELSFDDNPDSPYGRCLVEDMIEPQQDYNRLKTRARELREKNKPVWMVPRLGVAGSDRWEDIGTYQKVFYDPAQGGPGNIITPPAIPADIYREYEIIKADLDDIAGIHDPNFRGTAGPGVTSGRAIDSLKQGDSSRLSRFASRIERLVRNRDTWRIRHAMQFFDEPRLMGLDDNGNPGEAAATAQAFKALSGGGQVRVDVKPGSSLADTPDARNEKIRENYKDALYGPVGSPAAAKIAAKLMDNNDGDLTWEQLDEMEQKIGADGQQGAPPPPPPPTPEQQMQMQQALTEHQAQIDTQKQIALLQAQSKAKMDERENEYLLQRKYGPLLASPSATLTPGAENLVEEHIFGSGDLHESAGHVAGMAMVEPALGSAYGMTVPPPPPALPGDAKKPGSSGSSGNSSSSSSTTSKTSKGN